MTDDEPRYTPDEFFDKYFEFLRDERDRLRKRGIRTWEHEELLLRYIAYLKNMDYRFIKGVSERRKSQIFGDSGDGLLFRE